ncbi:HD domain-containing protein [Lactobacillus sanfranciscensis]|nr:bis(5'-nucleosyl)-tetraphosphatase (symmetrical) YqeK [Fructilactobacillus sanfranciscensis]NDR75571.1 HD domain-containing protein [Fructilactobacillus sanfranciscensis]NDR96329.1 HD domain-containing protein [Fructilactobacillus sanfranciscensis]NDS04106.1 HD domain-containing protein [Fructilactobacillus sanfranciscensis]POH19162.1 HD domain-containing protein [Fructilactobacillus sanfranciscensis]POH22331.1 HD domain-containing protein [Fructilactobacillus sanfranciscensis]
MNEVKYDYTNYAKMNRTEILEEMKKHLNDKRFQHCLRVEQTAIDLANENGVNPEIAGLAGLVHDYAKQRPNEDFIKVIKEHHLDPDLLNYGKAIWHGYVGYLLVQAELGINDARILNAVKYHTIGAPDMDKYAQVTYMADFIEPDRDFSEADEARKITHKNLWDGVIFQNEKTMQLLVGKNKAIYPAAIVAYNSIVAGLK